MKLAKREDSKIFWTVVFFLIVQTLISSELFTALGLIVVAYYIFIKNHGTIFVPFSQYKILILFLVWGAVIGLVLLEKGESTYLDYFRDVFYFTNPLLFLLIGCIYAREKVSIYKIFNGFIIGASILSVMQIIKTIQDLSTLYSAFTVQGWRNVTGDGVFVGSVAIAIFLSGIIPKNMRLSNVIISICMGITIINFGLTLSRTNTLIVVILYCGLSLQRNSAKQVMIRIISGGLLVVIGGILMIKMLPEEITQAYVDKVFSSFSEISAKNSWDSNVEIQNKWRGYETNCAIEEWEDSNMAEKMLGNGFGKRVYVGEYAYTLLKQTDSYGNPVSSIAILHNGYATMLIKLGVLGVMIYIIFYISIIKNALKAQKKVSSIDSVISLSVGSIFLLMTYFLNGLFVKYCFYPLIILMGYSSYNLKYLKYKESKQ